MRPEFLWSILIPMSNDEIMVRKALWQDDSKSIIEVRMKVFVEEQNVPAELEQDGRDPVMFHVLASDLDRPVGTARMDKTGHIGRVAVLRDYRGRGIGVMLMKELESLAVEENLKEIHLNAQVQAKGFYQALGYTEEGDVFEEAGISHIHMKKNLAKSV